ncbi:hypothetical protein DPMN_147519 [Dreissena polymorpha]|uniref:Uncharacterized protein n=1 Tax=Dreissena polymorpha TaxID=45954 RepID=A0A9D4F811_DREPO|nr:hypothetical protein DPMN_147519 [Dreissena polymorpha]
MAVHRVVFLCFTPENAKRDRWKPENFQAIQREYDEKLDRLKGLEERIRKREEIHRQKEIDYDKKLKCLQEKEMTIFKKEKCVNIEKEKCESGKREFEQKIKQIQEKLSVSKQTVKQQPVQEKRTNLKEEQCESKKRDYGNARLKREQMITKLRECEQTITELQEKLAVSELERAKRQRPFWETVILFILSFVFYFIICVRFEPKPQLQHD